MSSSLLLLLLGFYKISYPHPNRGETLPKEYLYDDLNPTKQIEICYKKYLELHRKSVKNIFESLNTLANESVVNSSTNEENPLNFIFAHSEEIKENIESHDLSKYEPTEFKAYQNFFYPENLEQKRKSKDTFEKAHQHHITTNSHHWQYWCDYVDGKWIPRKGIDVVAHKISLIEEVCNWASMSQMKGTKIDEYYKINFEQIIRAEYAKEFFSKLVKIIAEHNFDVSGATRQEFLKIQDEYNLQIHST